MPPLATNSRHKQHFLYDNTQSVYEYLHNLVNVNININVCCMFHIFYDCAHTNNIRNK